MKNIIPFFKKRSKQIDLLIDLQIKNNIALCSINAELAKLSVIIDYRGKSYDPKGFQKAINEANSINENHFSEKFDQLK